jgi:hypothetical protein
VVVAATAVHRQRHPRRASGFHTVDDTFCEPLFYNTPSFAIESNVTMKACGDDLIFGGIRKEVPCELLDRKTIKGHIRIKGFNYPVTPRPHGACGVALKAVAVGIAREI